MEIDFETDWLKWGGMSDLKDQGGANGGDWGSFI